MKTYLILSAMIIIGVFLVLPYYGIGSFIILGLIEWATKFVLPWIVLYWLIRAIKIIEKKGSRLSCSIRSKQQKYIEGE